MNTKYTATNLQFYLCGTVHYIDDDLSDCEIGTDDARLVRNNVNDALNIYFTGSLRAGNSGIDWNPGVSEWQCVC